MQQTNESFRLCCAQLCALRPIPMDVPFSDASAGPFTQVGGVCWLYLYDQDGTVGEGPVPGAIRELLPQLLCGETEAYQALYDRLFWLNRNRGFSSPIYQALGAVDLILNDMMAKRAGLPLHRFWGATRDWVAVYASGHGTHVPTDDLVREALQWKELGYSVYKMKVGTDFGTRQALDVERVKTMREVIGPQARLAIDANQIWTAEEAMEFFRKVEPYDIYWYEEPVHSHELWELEKICRLCPAPVSMGESLHNRYFFKSYLDAGVGQFQANPSMMGYRDWCAVRDLAREHGLLFSGGGIISSAFLATAGEDCYEEFLRPRREPVLRCMKLRPQERDGRFYLPDSPGLPLQLDLPRMRRMGLLDAIQFYYPL